MLALCLMLLGIYYAQNYAGIIGWCLYITVTQEFEVGKHHTISILQLTVAGNL